MITIGANGKRIAYGIKHYNLDTEADLEKMSVQDKPMGCTCFVISTSKYYMLNGNLEWIEISPFGTNTTTNGGGGSGGDIIVPPSDDEEDDIIYDGGVI